MALRTFDEGEGRFPPLPKGGQGGFLSVGVNIAMLMTVSTRIS
ncbi:hypothetical protein DSTSK_26370 [Desulforhabdus sp. TSK]|nr:hypothetical protein DSTSK_26370 [Desulforhabdus sp. TSK]